jgi:hypothetical protein
MSPHSWLFTALACAAGAALAAFALGFIIGHEWDDIMGD